MSAWCGQAMQSWLTKNLTVARTDGDHDRRTFRWGATVVTNLAAGPDDAEGLGDGAPAAKTLARSARDIDTAGASQAEGPIENPFVLNVWRGCRLDVVRRYDFRYNRF